MTDKTQNFDGNVEGHMLPTNLQTGPTSDPRTDAQIAADAKSGQDSPYTFRSFTGKDKAETYAEYLKRTEGLVDFTPLTEAAWRGQTGQKTQAQEILADLGIPELAKPLAPAGPLSDEEAIALNDMLGFGVQGNFQNTVPDVVYPAKLQTPKLAEDLDSE
jgi:hypothetical protein